MLEQPGALMISYTILHLWGSEYLCPINALPQITAIATKLDSQVIQRLYQKRNDAKQAPKA
jgi:hypothetical protein